MDFYDNLEPSFGGCPEKARLPFFAFFFSCSPAIQKFNLCLGRSLIPPSIVDSESMVPRDAWLTFLTGLMGSSQTGNYFFSHPVACFFLHPWYSARPDCALYCPLPVSRTLISRGTHDAEKRKFVFMDSLGVASQMHLMPRSFFSCITILRLGGGSHNFLRLSISIGSSSMASKGVCSGWDGETNSRSLSALSSSPYLPPPCKLWFFFGLAEPKLECIYNCYNWINDEAWWSVINHRIPFRTPSPIAEEASFLSCEHGIFEYIDNT